MSQPQLTSETIAQQGELLYRQEICPQVETAENIGKLITIDLNTGDYEIDQDLIQASHRLRANHPDAIIWTERIGYDAVYAIGGTLTRTAS
jgi:hypothetical protein